ncbi:DNA processing protein [Oceaniovalibus guishaninsula JLT2003]|uniref:DNA processing protein n=1 Tax=Oceaniovalibus guishaninsula JLT2003 TaxID=1231392 RepID=K2I606_9RHOB|nr:DNA processing protein [Oceaniovalibus guishaninsula JLT2003]
MRSRRVGVATFFRLLRDHGSAAASLEALPEVARAAGVSDYRACPPEVAEAELRAARLAGATMVCWGEPTYPSQLSDIPDPPPFLWAMGDMALLERPAIALVGARNASSLGLRMARTLARGIGEAQAVTVSGLARGIDAAAHEAALPTGTIAVMAGGVDVVYPSENAVLAQEIAEQGLRLSERPMGLQPQARDFPRRNRIVSGLSRAVVVVEAAAKSGSLITARDALDQGREVMAVPGHPFDARAAGCNMLIRDGATLVRGTQDLAEVLGGMRPQDRDAPAPSHEQVAQMPRPEPAPKPARNLRETHALHRRILDRLGPVPTLEDQLIRDLGAPAAQVTAQIVHLEVEGRLSRHAGGMLSRAAPPAE